ncbi:MAG: DUF427 domain-containing protein [Polyangiaceae bacterium]|nr:DUF427 domain-containing protein [Polyangiaceae bacterium]
MLPSPAPHGPGQESVWAYPRPPRLEACDRHIVIVHAGLKVVDSRRTLRLLETSHPPTYYVPPDDVHPGALVRSPRTSFCEWKGHAVYHHVQIGETRLANVAWSYPTPTPDFASLARLLAFYAGPFDACYVDNERVTPQPGGFYGGWITSHVVGPFKGEPGSAGW